jgi:hypothetical protein
VKLGRVFLGSARGADRLRLAAHNTAEALWEVEAKRHTDGRCMTPTVDAARKVGAVCVVTPQLVGLGVGSFASNGCNLCCMCTLPDPLAA